MRKDINMLCVTNWGEVLELKTHPYYFVTHYDVGGETVFRHFNEILTVADPDAVDVGIRLSLDEIKLVIRKKR